MQKSFGGKRRTDGAVHKNRPNIESRATRVEKAEIGGKDYFVRFTVANEKSQSDVHSQFVGNVELYDNTAKSLSDLDSSLQSRGTFGGIVDAKVPQMFDINEGNEEKGKLLNELDRITSPSSREESAFSDSNQEAGKTNLLVDLVVS